MQIVWKIGNCAESPSVYFYAGRIKTELAIFLFIIIIVLA